MIKSSCIGFCRSKDNKKLGETIDNYLSGKISEFELKQYCKKVRLENIQTQKEHKIDYITSNDFAMYDHMIDATCLVGNIQKRYYWEGGKIPLEIYFSLVKGMQKDKFNVTPLELQNYLNTNYLYYVPELTDPIEFSYSDNKPIVEYLDAMSIGVETKSTIISPTTYLLQCKVLEQGLEPLDLLEDILPVYKELFDNYNRINVKDVQIEDPMISLCIDRETKDKYAYCYNELRKYAGDIKIHLTPYYGELRENFDFISSLPVDSIHIDVPYNKNYIEDILDKVRKDMKISLGVVDARNVWKNNLNQSIDLVSKFCNKIGEDNVIISTSSPLFVCPYSVDLEENLPNKLKGKLSFAVEKLDELEIIKTAINCGKNSVSSELNENKKLFSNKIYNYSFGELQNEKNNIKNHNSKWGDFTKSNNLKQNPMFCFGSINKDLQNIQDIDIFSASFTEKSYDIKEYKDFSNGIFVCENNTIPRFGTEYYNPTIIYDNLSIKDDIFVKSIKKAKSETKKPIKFSVISPLHLLNFAFVSPFIDVEKLKKTIYSDLSKSIKKISKDIDMLQVNDFTITTNCDISNIDNINYIKKYCDLLNEFICSLNGIKCIGYGNLFCNINDYIEYFCKMNIDIFITSSCCSKYHILNSFIKYKPEIPVAFGAIDPYGITNLSKNDLINYMKKLFSSIDKNSIIFTTDGDFNENYNVDMFNKNVKNLYSAVKDVYKEILANDKVSKKTKEPKEEKKTKKKKEAKKTIKKEKIKEKINDNIKNKKMSIQKTKEKNTTKTMLKNNKKSKK